MKPKGNNNFIGRTGYSKPGKTSSKSKRYSSLERIATFRLGKPYKVIGYIFLAFSFGLFLLMSASEYKVIKYFFAAFFVMIGIYFLLSFYISKLCLDDEKIVFHNFLGRKKELLWSDITSVLVYLAHTSHSTQENIDVCSDIKKITVDKRFQNYKSIKTIITEKCPKAFPVWKIENGGTQVFNINKENDAIVFCFTVFGVILAAFGIAACAGLDSGSIAGCFVMSAILILPGLALLLLRLVSRVYADAISITHINLFGSKKQLMWNEITSVKFAPNYITLSDGSRRIIILWLFLGFEAIKDIVKKYYPEITEE